jgi:hypothetical protein
MTMTIPAERTKSVLQTRKFLEDLNRASKTPGVPLEIREQAHYLLRHFPFEGDMRIAATVCPSWFGYDKQLGMDEPNSIKKMVYRFISKPERATSAIIWAAMLIVAGYSVLIVLVISLMN